MKSTHEGLHVAQQRVLGNEAQLLRIVLEIIDEA
jgi:hypothetical protein